jgi:hypothetical protein
MTDEYKDRIDGWEKLIRAVGAVLKDLALVGVSCYSIYLQAGVSTKQDTIAEKVDTAAVRQVAIEAKVDTAAVTAAEVKKDLKAASSAVEKPAPQE